MSVSITTERNVLERRSGRRWIGWASLAALVIAGALLMVMLANASSVALREGQDPESAGQNGTLALAELLRQRGVEVEMVRSRTAAASALDDTSTLVTTDPYALSDDAVETLLDSAQRTVVLTASSRMLRLLGLGEDSFASTTSAVEASCDVADFARVGTIRPGRLFLPGDGVTGCFTDADGDAAVLVREERGVRTTLLDGSRLFSNSYLAEDGNAALGLALLGQTDHVVWYVPSFADTDLEAQAEPNLGALTPGWVTPAVVLLLLAGVVAAIWRGRRFGPLVAETLPVTVRASETMHGRARLTAKAADAPHAAEALREGSSRRLARRLGLHERATGAEVADAAADRLRLSRADTQALLAGRLPTSDGELIDMARRLSELEAAVDTAVRTERSAT